MKKNGLHKAVACAMIGIVASFCAACGQRGNAKSLTVDIRAQKKDDVEPCFTDKFKESTADFSVRLFRECANKEENMMISPVSMLLAMSMTAQGAGGNTLQQMQKAMYGGAGVEEARAGLLALQTELFAGKKAPIKEVNSIWFRDDGDLFKPNEQFLERNKFYLGSEVYSSKFDQSTVEEINHWVEDKTNGQIKNLVDKIDPHDVMHLINAVSFEDKWKEEYDEEDLNQDRFTSIKGEGKYVTVMNSTEKKYMEDEKSVGVIKPYKNGYSFVAILPNEGVSLSEYIKGMSGETFLKKIRQAEDVDVITKIPRFKSEYSILANDVLKRMGMSDAFDMEKANFSGMGSAQGRLFINSVVQKTCIEVSESGTKASAATDIGMRCTGAIKEPERIRTVELTRPFIYAIINDKTSLPVFMGTVTEV